MKKKLTSLSEIQLIVIARELDVLKNIERAFLFELKYNVKISGYNYSTEFTYKEALVTAITHALT